MTNSDRTNLGLPPVVLQNVSYETYNGHNELTKASEADFSLKIPLEYELVNSTSGKIAVVCHLFYSDMASEFRRYFEHIDAPFDVFISTDSSEKRAEIAEAFADFSRGAVDIRCFPNRGRDIAPKVSILSDIIDQYEFVCCVHSKASTHHPDLKNWRHFLLHHLMGSPRITRSILEIFEAAPEVGLIAPQHHEPVRKWVGWSGNYPITRDVARRMGVQLEEQNALDFPSGSMFWARTSALRPIIDMNIKPEEFAVEDGQKDETIAHAIERLFYFSAERAGLHWLKIADPSHFVDQRGIAVAETPELLKRLIHERALTLTKPIDAA